MSRLVCLKIGLAVKTSFTRNTTICIDTVNTSLTLGLASTLHPLAAGELDAQAFVCALGTSSDHLFSPKFVGATIRNNCRTILNDRGYSISTSYKIVYVVDGRVIVL